LCVIIAVKLLEESGLDVTVLDAYEVQVRRIDGHRVREKDCLHHCYPGVVDVTNRLLLHFLMMERTHADVDRFHAQIREAQRSTATAAKHDDKGDNDTQEAAETRL